MAKVKILPENLANKIAAGEVVERPASVVKELIENSLDAESTEITVEAKAGGKDLIRVIDNGFGMTHDDAILAMERHATSKIQSIEDLETITTMGFRGEALPSIASISHLELITRPKDAMEGTKVTVEGGVIKDVEQVGCPVGTRISVTNLFFNVPARRKFLKSTSTELNHIISHVTWFALAHPGVAFKLSHNTNTLIEARRCNNIMERIHILYGRDFAENIVYLDREFEAIKLQAFIGKPEFTRSDREHQLFFMNRRPIRSRLLGGALSSAFQTILPKGRYPVAILFLEIDPRMVDVNVHPSKMEVRFRDERAIYSEVSQGLLLAMRQQEYIPEIYAPVADIPSPPESENEVGHAASLSEIGNVEGQKATAHPRKPEVEASITEFLKRQERRTKIISNSVDPNVRRRDDSTRLPTSIEKPPARQPIAGSIALPLMDLENIRIKGRLFNTYIIVETGSEVLFIDQHIAEEKVIYEKLKKQVESQEVPSQGLLLPVTVELSPIQSSVLDSAIEILKDMGFDMGPYGGRTVVVRAIPAVMQGGDVKLAILDLMDQIARSPDKQDKFKLQEEALITTACHSSIQAGEEITDSEAMNLLKELFNTTPPFVCPHGRPIVVRMNRAELEGKFQRR